MLKIAPSEHSALRIFKAQKWPSLSYASGHTGLVIWESLCQIPLISYQPNSRVTTVAHPPDELDESHQTDKALLSSIIYSHVIVSRAKQASILLLNAAQNFLTRIINFNYWIGFAPNLIWIWKIHIWPKYRFKSPLGRIREETDADNN